MRSARCPRMVAAMSNVENDATQSSAPGLWAMAFAGLYEPVLWIGERLGMRAHRRELLAHTRGRTVELGSGTGLNLAHYPDDVDELISPSPKCPCAPDWSADRSRRPPGPCARRSRRTAAVR